MTVASGSGVADPAVRRPRSDAPTAAPQLVQNFAPSGIWAPQLVQNIETSRVF